jgi:hypothetical protein
VRPNATEFTWSNKKRESAVLVAEDLRPDVEIAQTCGIHKATLERWKQHPTFRARVDEIRASLQHALLEHGIGHYAQRLRAMNQRWLALQQVVAERATHWANPENWLGRPRVEPGATTGLLTRTIKTGKYGAVEEWQVDTALLGELLQIEKQAAREMERLDRAHQAAETTTSDILDGHPERWSVEEQRQAVIKLLAEISS